jgi:hypothetical protein
LPLKKGFAYFPSQFSVKIISGTQKTHLNAAMPNNFVSAVVLVWADRIVPKINPANYIGPSSTYCLISMFLTVVCVFADSILIKTSISTLLNSWFFLSCHTVSQCHQFWCSLSNVPVMCIFTFPYFISIFEIYLPTILLYHGHLFTYSIPVPYFS